MVTRNRTSFSGKGLSIVVCLVMSTFFQASSQQRRTLVGDACPAGWYTFNCTGIRLCVSQGMDHVPYEDTHENAANAIYGAAPIHDDRGSCIEDYLPVPEAYTHASQKQLSFYEGYYDVIDTPMFTKVVKIDDADFTSQDSFRKALERFTASFKDVEAHDPDSFRAGQAARKEVIDADAAAAQIPLPKTPPTAAAGKDVCPTGWARYSCQFARLCLSPDLLEKSQEPNALETRGEFVFAKCKADDRTAPDASTHASPYMVGYAAGFRLFDAPKYFKVVKVDSSYVHANDNWNAPGLGGALERAGLSLLPPSAVQEYARGWHDGNAVFQSFVAKEKLNAKKSEGAEEPH